MSVDQEVRTNDLKQLNRSRRFPIGAEITGEGVSFRVWAPRSQRVAVQLSVSLEGFENGVLHELQREDEGYFSGIISEAREGMFYKLGLDTGTFPDPASRFQPNGPHGPSEIINSKGFIWTDSGWGGLHRTGQVIYEVHIGTFTPEGTWRAAQEQLCELASIGITTVELMPAAEFAGRFGWGYDGVDPFAPTHLYGRPDEMREFVNCAHELGMGVILDVVYNHFGPNGNYLNEFSGDYVSVRHKNEWGEAINYDGDNSAPVREFVITNAVYWIEEFHLDGFRFDATQQIFDCSQEHILAVIARETRKAAHGRSLYLAAENESQEATLVRPDEQGGYGLDAVWNDDFHHTARVALTGKTEAYYTDYRGTPQEFISAVKRGWLYQGQWYVWQGKRRGTSSKGLHPSQFICFLQNHDQIGNSLRGLQIHALSNPGLYRALTALLLLGPATPLLFQGQEFGASSPFLYFADHPIPLATQVRDGRKQFLFQFPSIASAEAANILAPPEAEETFRKCKLDFRERQTHAGLYALHRDLIEMRHSDAVFGNPRMGGVDGAVLGGDAFVLRFFDDENADRLLLINLGVDVLLEPAPEPLLAPPDGQLWTLKWSSEDVRYGGAGVAAMNTANDWRIPGKSASVLVPETNPAEIERQRHARECRRTA